MDYSRGVPCALLRTVLMLPCKGYRSETKRESSKTVWEL
jgi:hypothetical protein